MNPALRRNLRLLLAALAMVYALLACLRTVGDFDTGWHLATGRYVLQHHAIPATDILSYTAAGTRWLYPPFAGVLLYAIFHWLGYAGLSWFCAVAGALLAAYLLWRALPGAALAAALLLALAVPSLAYRLTPRADLFTTLLFAVFLSELWRFHRAEPARLWLLPPLMVLWVNLHGGFIAGLGLLAAYVLIEALQLPFADLRSGARERLLRGVPWLVATAVAVLVNPWGVGALRQALQLANVGPTAPVVGEFTSAPLSWHLIPQAFDLRDPDSSFCWLLAVAAVALLLAVGRRQFGAAVLLGLSVAASIRSLRYQALFSIVVIVVAGTLLSEPFVGRGARPRVRLPVAMSWALVALLAGLCGQTAVRIADLVSNRQYVVSASISSFGPGESWWFPERAAAFIESEKLPGNIFEPYNLGGFAAVRLGPEYLDYIDGRFVPMSLAVFAEEEALLGQSPDSTLWDQVASRRNINVILLPLGRYGGLGTFDLNAYCHSTQWQPVHLDEASLVLMRRTGQNKAWLDRLAMRCDDAVFTPPRQASHSDLFQFYANSGAVLYALARDGEAESAWKSALGLEPEDPNVHLFLAQLYQQQQRPADAEREYRAALRRRQSATAWYALGRLLAIEHRYEEAERAISTAAAMTATPANQYKALGQVQLHLNESARALDSLRKAERAGPPAGDSSAVAVDFRLQLADGRAAAWTALHDLAQATANAEEAARLAPDAKHWNVLADCYAAQGRAAEAEQARSRARQLSAPH